MNNDADNTSAAPPGNRNRLHTLTGNPEDGRMATILQVIPALGSGGGVERGTVEIAEAITDAGGRALVVSVGGSQVHEIARAGGEHIELPLHSKNPVVIYKNILRLAALIERENVDLVHVRSRAPAWSALYAAKRTKRPLVTTFHGTYNTRNFIKRAYNSVMTKGERVIAISDFIAEHVHRLYGVPASRLRIIHRGVDLYRFNPANVSYKYIIKLFRKTAITRTRSIVKK